MKKLLFPMLLLVFFQFHFVFQHTSAEIHPTTQPNLINEESRLHTPINDENMARLLKNYNITAEDLENLLSKFGETVNEYESFEALNEAVSFYLHHSELLLEAGQMLSEIGLSEEEVESIFTHFKNLEDEDLQEVMASISSRLEKHFAYDETDTRTKEQGTELLALYSEMISVFQFKSKYYLETNGSKKEISYNDLVNNTAINDENLVVELYNQSGELVVDLQLSKETLSTDSILVQGEQLLNVAGLANQVGTTMNGDQLPNTASPYVRNMFLGTFILMIGICLFFILQFRKTHR